MISVNEAKSLTEENSLVLEPTEVLLYEATGKIITSDIYSNTDVPPFNQSSMDGYGFRYSDWNHQIPLEIIDEIPAGVFSERKLLPNTAVRIFTGAPVPEGCDTVVMQEKVKVIQNKLYINDELITEGKNVRLQGVQTTRGSIAVTAGTKIMAGVAGYLAGLGVEKVPVYRYPKICIITTGKELTPPGQQLKAGKVYECNSYSLNAALREIYCEPVTVITADDKEAEITKAIETNLLLCDIIIVSGGVSVGDYDFVAKAFDNCGVKCIFHKVKQKPGKPIYFGKKNNTLVFGLPGNPSALLTCYHEYIFPSIMKMTGHIPQKSDKLILPLANTYSKKEGLTHFLQGKIKDSKVFPFLVQESFQMSSFASADCIIQIDEEVTEIKEGSLVEVHILNQY